MNKKFGIRHEDKYLLERRTAIVPKLAGNLISSDGLEMQVQRSEKRIFTAEEYEANGASIVEDLGECPVIFGVKEMPESFFEDGKTYIFFSHVIKGQSYNMPMLRTMMEKGCTLIDYEKVIDDQGRRLIFFGRYAGLAGMIDSLWALGLRLKSQWMETPFLHVKQSHTYPSLEEAIKDISKTGLEIARFGLPKVLKPFVIGFTGYGNVSKGAQEISSYLPMVEIAPEELSTLHLKSHLPENVLYKVVFKEEDLVSPIDPDAEFDLQHYYKNPDKYKSRFDEYVPYLSVLMNCMYWDDKYPKLITKDDLKAMYAAGEPKLKAIGDITCDVDGSIESTVIAATIEDPIFVYNPANDTIKSGYEGEGLQMMTVDILPSELPRESSMHFSDALSEYVKDIVEADYNVGFDDLSIPSPIKRAMILHKGKLTPEYEYIAKYL